MPKDTHSLSRCLKFLISNFGENVFSINNVVLFYKLCEVKVDPKKQFSSNTTH